MDDYIVKPVTLDRLAVALAKCRPLATATAPEAAAAPPIEKQRIAAGTARNKARFWSRLPGRCVSTSETSQGRRS
jgi:hypothetical protein